MEGEGTRNDIGGSHVNGPVIQARNITGLSLYAPPAPPAAPDPAPGDRWAARVHRHPVWTLADDPSDTFRTQAVRTAHRLAWARDAAQREVAARDPWLDTTVADRMLHHTGALVARLPADRSFSPAEAVLLTLAPLLYQVAWVRAAARLADPSGEDERQYERFCRRYPRLVRAAALDLPDRPGAREQIGWWLFHQWLASREDVRRPAGSGALADEVAAEEPLVRRILRETPVPEILYGLRLDPVTLCRQDRPRAVPGEVPLFGGFADAQDRQVVRARMAGLLLAVAHVQALELPDLPETVVRHVGIPGAVDLGQLRETVEGAAWDAQGHGQVLRAKCHHEAVLKALRQHAERVDALLHAVWRETGRDATLGPLQALPLRASADAVAAAEVDECPVFTGEGHQFRLDEQRVQELLMGENLYRDRALAVRELYQNALDACRYRQARLEYLAQTQGLTSQWRGAIAFAQGRDEQGRHYLDCSDNGVGMGEEELTGVFSQAGVRFPELTEFLDEKADWDACTPPVRLYPNSRFGIGVLSYFMLADEIEVTTCRMDRNGHPGPEFRVAIVGPGHLFRIRRIRERGEPGTRVRLYLRDGDRAPSCVRELDRLLGIAEYATTAAHEGQGDRTWEPGVLRARERPSWEEDGLEAHGTLVPCAGGQVVWCEQGGGLLVDGLLVRPSIRSGVLAFAEHHTTLTGVVVNLTRQEASPRLTVDRTTVLDDVSPQVEELVRAAARELTAAQAPLPRFDWLTYMFRGAPLLADVVTEAATASGCRLSLPRGGTYDMAVAGFFLGDEDLYARGATALHHLSDSQYLWRALANPGTDSLALIEEAVGGLDGAGPFSPARPTDALVMASTPDPSSVIDLAARLGLSPRRTAQRFRALGSADVFPERFSPRGVLSDTESALLNSARGPVAVGDLLNVHLRTGIGLSEAARRLQEHGVEVPHAATRPDRPDRTDLRLLSVNLSGDVPWLSSAVPVPPGHLLAADDALGIGVGEAARRLAAYGFRPPPVMPSGPPGPHDLALLSATLSGRGPWLRHAAPVLPPGYAVAAAASLGISLAEVRARLADYGFALPPLPPTADGDLLMLSADGDGVRPWRRVEDTVSWTQVCAAAWALGRTPPAVADRLEAYGFTVSPPVRFPEGLGYHEFQRSWSLWREALGTEELSAPTFLEAILVNKLSVADAGESLQALGLEPPLTRLPAGLSPQQALVLLSRDLDGKRPWLPEDAPVPLAHLVNTARDRRVPLEEAAALLRSLNLTVPDVATTIRAALARVPRP